MDRKIEQIMRFRQFLLKQTEALSITQLNRIPEGFGNNIIWNLGHIEAVVYNVCYRKAGLSLPVDEQQVAAYLPGTRPDGHTSPEEVDRIRTNLVSSMLQLQEDYDRKVFAQYTPSVPIQQVYGIEVRDIDDALSYLLYHEGYHTGCIASLMRFI